MARRELGGYDLLELIGAIRAWMGRVWQRLLGPPPVWTAADVQLPGAKPICPACTRPHAPSAQRCPYCHELVGQFRTILYLDWIYIWGRGMQDLVWHRKLTPLLRAGLIVLALQYLVGAFGGWWYAFSVLAGAAGAREAEAVWPTFGLWAQVCQSAGGSVFDFAMFIALVEGIRRAKPERSSTGERRSLG